MAEVWFGGKKRKKKIFFIIKEEHMLRVVDNRIPD